MFRSHIIPSPCLDLAYFMNFAGKKRAKLSPFTPFFSGDIPEISFTTSIQHIQHWCGKKCWWWIFFSTLLLPNIQSHFFPFYPGEIWWSFQIFPSPRGHAEAMAMEAMPSPWRPRPCLGFEDADEAEQRRMATEALEKMRRNGFAAWLCGGFARNFGTFCEILGAFTGFDKTFMRFLLGFFMGWVHGSLWDFMGFHQQRMVI